MVWNDYYGWTWCDYRSLGPSAAFHGGSWAYFRTGIGWSTSFSASGSATTSIIRRSSGFYGFGGGGFGIGFRFGNVGWIPLAPLWSCFHPWYGGGRATAFNNASASFVAHNIRVAFRNAQFAGGVTAVSARRTSSAATSAMPPASIALSCNRHRWFAEACR